MPSHTNRQTVDLSAYPDLVVIYLGMRVNALTGFRRLLGLGPEIGKAVAAKPDGFLLHEPIVYSLRHIGMREYWRDFDSLERWARAAPHQRWWQDFLRDNGGTGFWHEIYTRRGGIEAVYDDLAAPVGMMKIAPLRPAHGPLLSARGRLGRDGGP
jgi:hypothetical protein